MERDNQENGIVRSENAEYFLAVIATQFHSGEAVVKWNKVENKWNCLFTLSNRIISAIHSAPIDESSVVRIVKEQNIEAFDEYASGKN
jgi:hypothetical protein